jgi:hypothetical protein
MCEPEISEEKFQEWLRAHINIVMNGTQHVDAVRLLYYEAFSHGWHAALDLPENPHERRWHI